MPLSVRVLYFHTLRDLAGAPRDAFELPDGATLRDVVERAKAARPGLARAFEGTGWVMVAQNLERARLDDPLLDGAEVALMPPVSGG
jgi:molybdopterin synthase sulfur carrier subunit